VKPGAYPDEKDLKGTTFGYAPALPKLEKPARDKARVFVHGKLIQP